MTKMKIKKDETSNLEFWVVKLHQNSIFEVIEFLLKMLRATNGDW